MTLGLKLRLARYGIGGAVYVLALFGGLDDSAARWLFLAAYAIFGADVLFLAAKSARRGQLFNEHFLMSIATIGAIYIGLYYEAVLVMIFFQIGEFFQDVAISRSRRSIEDLMDIKAEYANIVRGGEVARVNPSDVGIGDIILIKPGEKVPLDGTITHGASQIDLSSLIGESVPRSASIGDEVLSGGINLTSILHVKVTKDYENSTAAKILDLVENASAKKSQTERFIAKFSRIYTPIVTLGALLLMFVPLAIFPDAQVADWVYRGIIFLMISCPCALHLSVPLSFFSGVGTSSARGVLVKGTTYMQVLADVDIIVFDKTGTITKGVFEVTDIQPEGDIAEKELISLAAGVLKFSNHPAARSIAAKAQDASPGEVTDFEELHGRGIRAKVDGDIILAGSAKLMEDFGVAIEPSKSAAGSVVYVARAGVCLGHIIISDVIKDDSAQAIKDLKKAGIKKTVMLSGDRTPAAQNVADAVGIGEVHAE
ncbi:MAG: cadmium-translocating P-type ATPase, partial [Defluviitaleaceae bacterium]|nr:cadmium-translocating P-type ATPase [Defluviitaleaceae bacterium]